MQYLALAGLGLLVGAYGTLIGAGGGFVLVPVLLLLYPTLQPVTITCITLAVVFCNALSGSVAYARMGRIDYRSAGLFCWTMIPGAILGVWTTSLIPRTAFTLIFGSLLLGMCVYLLAFPAGPKRKGGARPSGGMRRFLVEHDGTIHSYSYDPRVGLWLSGVIGFVASMTGVGGGIFHVPVLSQLLGFPVHIATATSHFVLTIMCGTATLVHILGGAFAHGGVRRTVALSVGVIIGAQVGARLSNRIRGDWIIRGLAVALGLVAVRILWLAR